MKKINKKGFTLVELLLVIAIIGILAAVLFVSLGKQRERARIVTFKENMRGMVSAYTACTDGGNIIIGDAGLANGSDSESCEDALGNNVPGYDFLPAMRDCDGDDADDEVSVLVPVDTGDSWYFQGTCNTTSTVDGGMCIANCDAGGCIFCNTALAPVDGVWPACGNDTNCD